MMVRPMIDRRATVGGPLFASREEMQAYAARVNVAVQNFDADVHANLVWTDPADLDRLSELYATSPFFQNQGLSNLYKAEAAILREREKARSPEQVVKERAFGIAWRTWLGEWWAFKSRVDDLWPVMYAMLWDQIEAHETQYHAFVAQYRQLGYKLGAPELATPAEIEKEHPSKPLIGEGGALLQIPWTPILVTAGLFGVAYLWTQHKSQPAEKTSAIVETSAA